MSTSAQDPDRVVDRDNYGWYCAFDGHGGSVYCIDYHTRIPNFPPILASSPEAIG
jgi:hypothetical protein